MPSLYNEIAGQSAARLAALSDGVFAVAMTLLVLDLRAPAVEVVHTEHDLWLALVALAPRLGIYMMSFLTLGIFWVGQQTQLNHLARSDRSLSWIHLVFLVTDDMPPRTSIAIKRRIVIGQALYAFGTAPTDRSLWSRLGNSRRVGNDVTIVVGNPG
jgi:uncharacterized membrane protein